jgi:hypothetical protein
VLFRDETVTFKSLRPEFGLTFFLLTSGLWDFCVPPVFLPRC